MTLQKKYDGILFDLDGTLLNTLGIYTHIMNELLKKNNFPTHTSKKYRKFIGNGAQNFIAQCLPQNHRKEETIMQIGKEFHLNYQNNYTTHSEVYTGILELLETLQSTGKPIALLSNKSHELTCKCAEHFFPTIKFKQIIGQSDSYKKPDPKGALAIANTLKLPLDKLVLVGDTEVDIVTAQNAGIDSIAVTWGFRDEEELKIVAPKYILSETNQLKNYLL